MKIEFDEECQSCDGTGIYVGMAERDGYGVVCNNCKGTGKHHFSHEYEEFNEIKLKDGVVTIVECNPGIILGGNLDFGGIPYEKWLESFAFPEKKEMRNFVCPAWWYQTADYDKKPNWEECGWGSFSQCKYFSTKEKCWERFDKENK